MARACRMATEAADDWIIPVNTAPTNTPSRGFSKAVSSPANWGISARGLTAPLISSMPYIKMAKPIMMRPTSRRRWRLEPMISRIPARAIRGEKFSGFSRFTKTFSLSMPVRDRIHAVRVVPMLAPMMMPMVCLNSMTPEFTRPTSITVMAEEDWMAMVMPAPSSKLLKGLEVMRLSIRSSLPPAIFSRLLDMTVMPYKKNARPPQRVKTEKMSITALSFPSIPDRLARPVRFCHVYCAPTLYMQSGTLERGFLRFCKICVKIW